MRVERPVVLSGRFTRQEEKILSRLAKDQDLTPSQYVRSAVIMALVLDGDLEAMKLVAGEVRKVIAERFGFKMTERATA